MEINVHFPSNETCLISVHFGRLCNSALLMLQPENCKYTYIFRASRYVKKKLVIYQTVAIGENSFKILISREKRNDSVFRSGVRCSCINACVCVCECAHSVWFPAAEKFYSLISINAAAAPELLLASMRLYNSSIGRRHHNNSSLFGALVLSNVKRKRAVNSFNLSLSLSAVVWPQTHTHTDQWSNACKPLHCSDQWHNWCETAEHGVRTQIKFN